MTTSGSFDALIANTPLCYESNRAHSPRDVLGTLVLGILSGHYRYAHLAALRGDAIAPALLGLGAIVSEDCVRRALQRIEPKAGQAWLLGHLDQSCHEFMDTLWVLDIDVTIKPVYGQQEGAEIGYNPQKPGRPSHAYHTYWIATLRLCLDVEVHPGNESSAGHGFDALWSLIERLPEKRRPHLVRGDCAYGQEKLMGEAEKRSLNYLFKLRQTTKAKDLVAWIEHNTSTVWTDAGQGWEGAEGALQLQGWTRKRRVVILRRRLNDQGNTRTRRRLARKKAAAAGALWLSGLDAAACEPVFYEYQILVTNLSYEILTLATLYRERGDAENPFDELKNQWSWGGFTTHTLKACQHVARLAALIYNWWTLYHRLLQPGQHSEAVSTRPQMLVGAARQTEHAGQRRLDVRLSHAEAPKLQIAIKSVSKWLHELLTNAQQWTSRQRWRQIVERILRENFPKIGPAPPPLLALS